MNPQPVIVVTDGDPTAFRAISEACQEIGLEVLVDSRGNPTPLSGKTLIQKVVARGHGAPMVVMVDDRGDAGLGRGERALDQLLQSEHVDVIGVVAVAAHTPGVQGVSTESSVTNQADVIEGAVDKAGDRDGPILRGDTVDILRQYPHVTVVGLGDPGKMEGRDSVRHGAPATTKALQELLAKGGYHLGGRTVNGGPRHRG